MLEDPRHICTSPSHEGLYMGLDQQGARNKPKIRDTLQTESPYPRDMGRQ